MTAMFASILEDTLVQLKLIKEINTKQRKQEIKADMQRLLENKYDVSPLLREEELLDNIESKNIDTDDFKLKKIIADRAYVVDIIITTYLDLAINRNFDTLRKVINENITRKQYLANLVELTKHNRIARRDLSKQLRVIRNNHRTTIYDLDQTIAAKKIELEDHSDRVAVGLRYTAKWEQSRQELQQIYLQQSTASSADVVEEFKTKIVNEQLVNAEIEMLVNIQINETLHEIVACMSKYDEDMEGIDKKVAQKRSDLEDMKNKRKQQQETFNDHQEKIDKMKKFKEDRIIARIRNEKMQWAALIVQAWWRGMCVRLNLGRYRIRRGKQGRTLARE